MGTHVAAGKRKRRTPRSDGSSSPTPTYRQNTLPGDCAGRSRLSSATEDVLALTFGQKVRAARPDVPGSTCGGGAMRWAKNGGACGTAKFREETSKKADSATRGRIAAVHNVGDRIVRLQAIICGAAFTKAGHGGYSTASHPPYTARKFRERRPHPATKAGCCRSGAEDSCPAERNSRLHCPPHPVG